MFRVAELRKIVQSVIKITGDDDTMPGGFLSMIMDGNQHGNEPRFESASVKNNAGQNALADRQKTTFFVHGEEKSLNARKLRVQGTTHLVEFMHVFHAGMKLSGDDRLHYPGSNMSNIIGPVKFLAYSDAYCVPIELKKKFLNGPNGTILAGGAVHPDDKSVKKPIMTDGTEPLTWYPTAQEFYEEIMHSFNIGIVLDCPCLDTTFAKAAIKRQVPYIGLVLSDDQREHARWALVKDNNTTSNKNRLRLGGENRLKSIIL